MKMIREPRAFSLLEVIVAVGLFGGAVAVIIGLMGPLSRHATDSLDVLAAQQLSDPLKIELTRLRGENLDELAAQIPVMAAPLGGGLAFASPRDAARVVSVEYHKPATDQVLPGEQYYLVECWKFPPGPLGYDPPKAFLALYVRVSWPYHLPGVTAEIPLKDRSQITFTASLSR